MFENSPVKIYILWVGPLARIFYADAVLASF